ncbi:MAG: DUF4416 family protein [Candidatus Omnitrophica bacterium]|jgi:hypothetical protein|nr:DUF4416 family protein [Candidatus Omnitrophota bacterium]
MGQIKKPYPAKLFFGFIYQDASFYSQAIKIINRDFGRFDYQSVEFGFDYTDYYQPEFGLNLKRRFVSCQDLIDPAKLYKIKIFSNRLEDKFSSLGKRKVNIDPGMLDLAKVVLATTKDFAHRVYLNKGIFAEVTLLFKGKTYQHLPWTYPDYRTQKYIDLFLEMRKLYVLKIKDL